MEKTRYYFISCRSLPRYAGFFFGGGRGSSTYRKGKLEDGDRGCGDNNPDQLPRKESEAQQAALRVGDTTTKENEQGESMGAGKGG